MSAQDPRGLAPPALPLAVLAAAAGILHQQLHSNFPAQGPVAFGGSSFLQNAKMIERGGLSCLGQTHSGSHGPSLPSSGLCGGISREHFLVLRVLATRLQRPLPASPRNRESGVCLSDQRRKRSPFSIRVVINGLNEFARFGGSEGGLRQSNHSL